MYIIVDWAGNILNFKGIFQVPELCVEMTFRHEDDAEEYLDAKYTDDERQDIFIEKVV